MNSREIFGLIIRLLGLIHLFYAQWYLAYATCQLADLENDKAGMGAYFILGVIAAITALYLLRGAPQLVRFSYPPTDDERQETNT